MDIAGGVANHGTMIMKRIKTNRFFMALILGAAVMGANLAEVAVAKDKDAAAKVTNLDAAKSGKLIKDRAGSKQAIVILDVRTPGEFKSGHLKGAKNIDFRADDFQKKLEKLDRSKPYLVHCRSGGRSTSSLAVFKKLGFREVYHMDGGMIGWKKSGGKVVVDTKIEEKK